ncbi:hypothetical protein NLU13_8190 [Sarocladium strictum]|uniref:Zn(2)-C6 fungal-type domain-containing protein n=1 Tax=Sarocladium strictum TaxID=5046 RepID=A0AA39GBP0_SARSR|nr:hypothetical protein NLU13_8190 [Sarocladium strictum]
MDPGPPHKRRRPAIACTECRRRKTSCDLGSPCGQCRKSRSNLRCVYNNSNNTSSSNNKNNNNNHKGSNKSSSRSNSNSSSNSSNSNDRNDSSNSSRSSNNSNTAGNRRSVENCPDYIDVRTRGESDQNGSRTQSNGGMGDDGFGGTNDFAGRISFSESEIVRSGVADEAEHAPSSYQLPSAALFSDSAKEGECGYDKEMLDLSYFSGSICFDMESTNALLPMDGVEESIWDAGDRLGFPAVFPYSRRFDATCDLDRYLRLPVTSSPPRMAVEPTQTMAAAPWNDVSVRRDGVRFLLTRYAYAGGKGEEVDGSSATGGVTETGTGGPLMDVLTHLERAARAAQEAQPDVALGPCPDPTTTTTVSLTVTTAKALLPSRPQCDVLVRAYVKTFESLLPILDVPWFLRQYQHFWDPLAAQPTSADQISICHILLVVTLGSCVTLSPLATADSQSALQHETEARICFARQWLARQMVSGYRASLGVAQSMCLLALTRVIRPQPSRAVTGADFIFGDYDLTRIGLQMGLHCEPTKRNPGMSAKEADMRRGLWTTMLELSLQRCFEKGLPAPLIPESYDCEPPSGTGGNMGEEDEQQEALWPGLCQVVKSPIPRMLAKTQRLRLQILSLINAPKTPKASAEGHQLAAELNRACEANLAALRGMTLTPPEAYQIHMMELFTRPFVLALHSPFAGRDQDNKPVDHYSRMTRMELSAQLLARPFSLKSAPHDRSDGGSPPSPSFSSLDATAKTRVSRRGTGSSDTMRITESGGTCGGGSQLHHTAVTHSGSMIVDGKTDSKDPVPDAYTSLLLYGHGPYANSKRQVAAMLFLDLITELEEDLFPTMLGPIRQPLRDQLSDVVRTFERRVIGGAGTHSTHELVLFSAAAAYVDGLLLRRAQGPNHDVPDVDVDEAVSNAAARALTLCAEVVTRKNPELAHGI